MLSKLISNANNNNNEHFIDRDGTYFSYILTFLRTLNYNHIYEIDDLNILPILIQECDFYCIDDLKTKLQNIVSSPSPSVRDQQVCILTCVSFLKTSKIKRLCANKTYVLDHIFPKEYSSWGFLLELIDDEKIVSTKKVAALKPKSKKKKEDDNDYDKKDEEDIKISTANEFYEPRQCNPKNVKIDITREQLIEKITTTTTDYILLKSLIFGDKIYETWKFNLIKMY